MNVSRYSTQILFCLVALSCVLRLYWLYWGLGSSHFSYYDEWEGTLYGEKWLYYSHARVSFGKLPGPWQNVLFLGMLNLVPGKLVVIYIVPILWGLLEIVLMYVMIVKWSQNKMAGLLGAFLMAFTPWALQFSYTFWNPYPVIPLITLTMIILHDVLYKERSKKVFWLILLIALMPFFHMMAFFAAVGLVGLILYEWKRIKLHYGYLGWGILVGSLLYVPFMYFELQNNFMILRGYMEGNLVVRKVEALKVISNHLVIGSHEISRLVGYNWKTYAFFLEKYYGTVIIPFLTIAPSLVLALYAWVLFFRKALTSREGPERKLLVFTILTLLSFLLTFQAHELRYVNVTWAVQFYVLATGMVALLEKYKRSYHSIPVGTELSSRTYAIFKVRKQLFRVLIVLYVLNTFYLSLILPNYYRYPNYEGHYRLIPSLLFFEKVETLLIDRVKERDPAISKPISHGAELLATQEEWKYSLWSFFYDETEQEALLQAYKAPDNAPKFFIETDFLETELYHFKEKQSRDELREFLNERRWLHVVEDPEEASATIAFVSREHWENHEKPKDYAIWGEFPNGYMIGKFLP